MQPLLPSLSALKPFHKRMHISVISSPLRLYRRTISYAIVQEVVSPSGPPDVGQLQSSAQKEPVGGRDGSSLSSEAGRVDVSGEGAAMSCKGWEKSSDDGSSVQSNSSKSSSVAGIKGRSKASLPAGGVPSLVAPGVGSTSFWRISNRIGRQHMNLTTHRKCLRSVG